MNFLIYLIGLIQGELQTTLLICEECPVTTATVHHSSALLYLTMKSVEWAWHKGHLQDEYPQFLDCRHTSTAPANVDEI